MSNKPFSRKLKKAKTERAEAMPAAIITAIVSSILLLGIAGVTSMVVNGKADAEADVTLTTAVSNIDVSLRSDVTNASYITAGAKLAPPASGTFTPKDLVATGANMHIPEADGKCKVVRWSLEGGQVSRDLTVYSSTNNSESVVSCNTSSTKVAERKKVFSDKLTSTNPFKFYNQVGRELAFNIDESKLPAINAEYQSIRNAQGGAPLNAEQLQALSNKHLTGNSIQTGFKNPTACPLKDSPSTGPCGAVEENIVAAWQSTKIAKVSKAFDITMNGTTQSRQVEQNSTVPLYLTAAEAKQAVYGVNTGNKPAKPNVTFATSDMILGKEYPISWSPSTCLASMELTLSYKIYEDNDLVKTVPGGTTSTTVSMVDSSDQYANYTVQAECARAALIVPSDPSDVKTATVTPDVPALVLNAQPAATNAALNSNIKATATCLYGTRAVYGLAQTTSSWGTSLPAPLTDLTSVNRAINSGFSNIVNGARYQYQVTAHCASDFKNSATASVDSRSFTTVNPAPTGLRFTAPADKAHSIATNANLTWTPVTCSTGTTPKYHLAKNLNNGAAITAQVLENWTDATSKASANSAGSEVGYKVQARCNGTAVNSSAISADLSYLTKLATPTLTFAATNVILGTEYPISWTAVACLSSTYKTLTYKIYEDNDVVKTIPGGTTSTTVSFTDSTDGNANYRVQAECTDGTNVAKSDFSNTRSATATPAAPALVLNAQPAATNAALNSNIKATATCLHGTTAVYGLKQLNATHGTISGLTNLTSVNRAINSGFSNIVNGARYQYQVTAHCASEFRNSATASVDSRSFTTVNPAPTGLRFTAPADKAHSIATNANLTWAAVTCPTGTTVKYYLVKNRNAGAAITAQVLENWTDARSIATSNTNGNEVGYQVKARCEGTAVNSPEVSASITYMTKVATPTLTFATTNMVMGTNYSMSWTAVVCQSPVYKTLSYKIYEDNDLVKTVAGGTLSTTVSFTDATDGNANYKVQAECSDGTTVAKSDFSNVRSATVTPAAPTLILDNQPVATDAALNANIKATATCLHGTKAVYTLKQLSATYGTVATLSDLASVNRAINNGFTNVVNGARYQYQVTANCATDFRSSGNATVNSRTFTTVNPTPAAIKFTAPTATSNVATNVALVWAKANCPTGTTAKYYMDKTHADGKAITPIVVDNWTTDTSYTTLNNQGTTVEYRVKTRCDGTAVNSGETAFNNVRFTTMIAAPGPALNVTNNGHGTVIWYAAAADRRCAAGTTTIYELVQTKRDNNAGTWWGGHITGGQAVLPAWNNSNAGYPQWAHVESWCRGANAESARSYSATTKWIPWIDVHVNGWQNWRRMNLYVACPNVHTWVGQARMYVTSEAWNGARQNYGIYTDAGNMIAASAAGPGGNTGWMTIGGSTRTDWIDSARAWGYWEHSGLGVRNNSRDVHATYWNATAWGPWGYWWYGTCTTPYVNATVKGYHMDKPSLAGSGNPWTVYNGVSTGNHRTTAGNNAIK